MSNILGPIGFRALTWTEEGLVSPTYTEFGWDGSRVVTATCSSPYHKGDLPSIACSCGIYVTTKFDIAASYMRANQGLSVMALVEATGKVIDSHKDGWRSEQAFVLAIVNVDWQGKPAIQKGERGQNADIFLWAVDTGFDQVMQALSLSEAQDAIAWQKKAFYKRVNSGQLPSVIYEGG